MIDVHDYDVKPRFEHDCDDCRFVGHYQGADVWSHDPNGDGAVIVRTSSEGPDYQSGDAVYHNGERIDVYDLTRIGLLCAQRTEERKGLPTLLAAVAHSLGHPAPPSRPSALAERLHGGHGEH